MNIKINYYLNNVYFNILNNKFNYLIEYKQFS